MRDGSWLSASVSSTREVCVSWLVRTHTLRRPHYETHPPDHERTHDTGRHLTRMFLLSFRKQTDCETDTRDEEEDVWWFCPDIVA